MKVKELVNLLQSCNQEADVVIANDTQISDYTWDTTPVPVEGIMGWPEPKETATQIEIHP